MSIVTLNLSRKWRSQNFDQIVGQELSIRILKNSLYLNHFFPVYLFSGQRGCGKTSTARIFAAAINCESLTLFQKNPKNHFIPCLQCNSCLAIKEGNHPDFIEIDAASHTGVDNIRSIIESSSLLPIMGKKRVYLIDEAHMLSKAAFNAALKILEEPPPTALFILATTNPHKIIDTVRSRCFQIFFSPVIQNLLVKHLEMICQKEKIAYVTEALDLIVRHTEGSVRDALNVLEQVRFSSSIVNKEAVIALLCYIDDQHIVKLIYYSMQSEQEKIITLLNSLHIDQHKAEFVWQRMITLVRNLLWLKYGIKPQDISSSINLLEDHVKFYSIDDLNYIIQQLYCQEELFLKTSMPHIFLEMFFIGLCNKNRKKPDNGNNNGALSDASSLNSLPLQVNNEEEEKDNILLSTPLSNTEKWQQFIQRVETLNDPLLYSVLKKAVLKDFNPDTNQVSVVLSKDFGLFKEWLDNSQKLWQPLLQNIFSSKAFLAVQFSLTHKTEPVKKTSQEMSKKLPEALPIQTTKENILKPANRYTGIKRNTIINTNNEFRIDVSDQTVWKKASMLLRYFPGTVTEIREKQ